jgi:integrase
MKSKERPLKVSVWARTLPSGKTTFLLDINLNGKRTYESLHLVTAKKRGSREYKSFQDQAEAIANERRKELRRQRYGTDTVPTEDRTIHSYFSEFCEGYKNKDYKKINALTKKVREHFSEKATLQSLNKTKCEDFRNSLTKRLKKETARNYFQVFKRVLSRAVDEGILQHSPAFNLVVKAPNDRLKKEVLDKDELLTLVNTPCTNDEIKRAFLFACLTGLGYKECLQAKWSNVIDNKGSYVYRYNRAKNDEPVEVHLVSRALEQLPPKSKKSTRLFPSLPSSNGANKCLKNWITKAGINKHITWYCARHTMGTLQAAQNINQKVISKNMGQTSTAHTEKYINHVKGAQVEAMKTLEF